MCIPSVIFEMFEFLVVTEVLIREVFGKYCYTDSSIFFVNIISLFFTVYVIKRI